MYNEEVRRGQLKMIKQAIYHRAKSAYAYAYDKETLHIRLRSAKNDIKSVKLLGNDPYDWQPNEKGEYEWCLKSTPMIKQHSTSEFDYWFIEIKPTYRRFKYGFILNDGIEELLFIERGFFSVEDEVIKKDVNSYFAFPYLNAEDVFKAPDWVRDTMWYQIFPERFANGDDSISPENVLPWGEGEVTIDSFYGGDLQGIVDKLDYLQELGINGLYLTPIFESPSTHKYDTVDYYKIDPHFGDNVVFKTLVAEAHQRGMKVMLDAVFNHMGYHSPQWQDVVKNGEQSEYKDWFFIHEFPVVDEEGAPIIGTYETFSFTPYMPKINTNHKEAKQYLIDIALYWIKEFGIDAWRLDVANEISHDFWRDFRKAVKEANPDLYIVGETWHDSYAWLLGDQFDAVMNYPLTKAILEFVATNHIDDQGFVDTIVEALYRYPANVNDVMFNLLDSHDTPRLATLADGCEGKIKLAYLLLYSLIGSPCIFYGSEVGLEGDNDTRSRQCMIWTDAACEMPYFTHLKRCIELRKEYSGNLEFIYHHQNTLIYRKFDEHHSIYFIINNNPYHLTIPLIPELKNKEVHELYGNQILSFDETVSLDSYGFMVVKAR